MKSKSLILLVVSGVFGLVAAVMISQVIGKGGSSGPQITMGPVLVAAGELEHNVLLTEENVTLENWPVDIIPENAARSFEEIENMAINTRLSSGLPILIGDLVNKNERNVVTVPDGFKVVSLKATSEDTMDGLLEPSDRVDVIGIFKVRSNNQLVTTAKTFLKDIVVFAIDSRMRRSTEGTGGGSGGSIVSLLLNEAQAEQFILVEKEATLKLVFRSKDMGQELDPNQELVDLSDVFNPGGREPMVQNNNGPQGNGYQPQQEEEDDGFVTRVYNGGAFEDVQFNDENRVQTSAEGAANAQPAPANAQGGGNFAGSPEDDTFFEEDQYPGE